MPLFVTDLPYATPVGIVPANQIPADVAYLDKLQTFTGMQYFSTPTQFNWTTFETAPAGNPAIVATNLITATPGIRFSDGTVQITAAGGGAGGSATATPWTYTAPNTYTQLASGLLGAISSGYLYATPMQANAPSNTPSSNLPYGPALTTLGLISATPGVRFSDGTIITTTSGLGGSKVFRTNHTWTIGGQIQAATPTDIAYIAPFFVDTSTSETVQIADVRYVIHTGGQCAISLGRLGIGGFTGMNNITVTTTTGLTTSATPVYHGDLLYLQASTPSLGASGSTPTNLTVTVSLEHTV